MACIASNNITVTRNRKEIRLKKPKQEGVKPRSAWQAVVHLCNYLRGTADLCIAAPMHQKDRDPTKSIITDDSYGDSDFAAARQLVKSKTIGGHKVDT